MPPSALTPAARSWPAGTIQGAAPPPPNLAPPPAPPSAITPDKVLGADAGLKAPRGIAVDANGDIYVGDTENHRVVHFNADGKSLAPWGGDTQTWAPGKFAVITDLGLTPNNHPVVYDNETGRRADVERAGQAARAKAPHAAIHGNGIGVGPDGRIYIGFTSESRILTWGRTARARGRSWAGPTARRPLRAAGGRGRGPRRDSLHH